MFIFSKLNRLFCWSFFVCFVFFRHFRCTKNKKNLLAIFIAATVAFPCYISNHWMICFIFFGWSCYSFWRILLSFSYCVCVCTCVVLRNSQSDFLKHKKVFMIHIFLLFYAKGQTIAMNGDKYSWLTALMINSHYFKIYIL